MESIERLGGEGMGQRTSIWKVALAGATGAALQWYDFFLYGIAAALVFNQLFFPTFDPLVGTLLSFGTFAIGFVSRPLGAVVFGHYGDKIGRKAMLVITLYVMGIVTFLIGLLPTYEAIGIWAPILLIVLRFCQGLGIGGEVGGATLMTVEHAPSRWRGFYGSLPWMGGPVGFILASGAVAAVSGLLSEEQFLAWGWRVPFLASIAIVAVGAYIRLRITETPAFEAVRETRTEAQAPVLETLRSHPKSVLAVAGMQFGFDTFIFLNAVFIISYLTQQLGLPAGVALNAVLLANVAWLVTLPVFGALSDCVGRKPVFLGGAVLMALLIFPYFWLLGTEVVSLIYLSLFLAGLVIGVMVGPVSAFFSELFVTRVRYSGLSLGFQLGGLFGGALMPIIATLLLGWSGGSTWSISVYMIVAALVAFVAALLAKETFREEIDDASRDRTREPRAARLRA